MTDCMEVLFVGDDSGSLQCVDPRIGTIFLNYRGLTAVKKNTLNVIGKDYLIGADSNKPILQLWPLNSQEPVGGPKIVLSKTPSALAVSPDGFHCVAAIEAKLFVYQLSTGCLIGVLSKHYRGITKILFAHDSTHFVSCGENGTAFVWNLATAVSGQGAGTISNVSFQQEPVFSFSHHSLMITDAFLSKSRLYTISIDQTCKMYDLRSGDLLLSVVFNWSLTAVCPNAIESALFLGTNKGDIVEFSLNALPRTLNHNADESEISKKFDGHENTVTCLDVSVDGFLLVSAGDDKKVITWDIASRQLLRVIVLKGSPTCCFLSAASDNIFSNDLAQSFIVKNLKRVSSEDQSFGVDVIIKDTITPIRMEEIVHKADVVVSNNNEEVEQLKLALNKALLKNQKLYNFAMEKILSDPHKFKNASKKPKLNGN